MYKYNVVVKQPFITFEDMANEYKQIENELITNRDDLTEYIPLSEAEQDFSRTPRDRTEIKKNNTKGILSHYLNLK